MGHLPVLGRGVLAEGLEPVDRKLVFHLFVISVSAPDRGKRRKKAGVWALRRYFNFLINTFSQVNKSSNSSTINIFKSCEFRCIRRVKFLHV